MKRKMNQKNNVHIFWKIVNHFCIFMFVLGGITGFGNELYEKIMQIRHKV